MKHKIIQSLIIVAVIWFLICTFAHKIYNYMPMNKRNIVHLNGFVGCICNSSETGFGNQMKESEASERKKTQTSLFFHLLFLCTMLIVASCNNRKQYDFQSSNDALEEYHNFFLSIKGNTGCNAEQMASFINGWHEVADTVSCFIKKDPSFTAHCGLSARYDEISDSIRTELLRLTSNCTLSDVAYVKLHTSVYKESHELDSLKESATKFFMSLDKSPVFDKDVHEGIANYSNFLLGSKAHGIKSKKELVAFLHEEDRHFRTFLANIDECSSMGMTEITNNTADICSNIYKAASEGILPTSETLVLMSMRTDRRLILNAQVCHDVLKRGKIKSANQANAYLWMMLQPYPFDGCIGYSHAHTTTNSGNDRHRKRLSSHYNKNGGQTLCEQGRVQQDTSTTHAFIHINHLIKYYYVTGSYLQIQSIWSNAVARFDRQLLDWRDKGIRRLCHPSI